MKPKVKVGQFWQRPGKLTVKVIDERFVNGKRECLLRAIIGKPKTYYMWDVEIAREFKKVEL